MAWCGEGTNACKLSRQCYVEQPGPICVNKHTPGTFSLSNNKFASQLKRNTNAKRLVHQPKRQDVRSLPVGPLKGTRVRRPDFAGSIGRKFVEWTLASNLSYKRTPTYYPIRSSIRSPTAADSASFGKP